MPTKQVLLQALLIAKSSFFNNENDERSQNELIVDFTSECIDYEVQAYKTAIAHTNQLLKILIADQQVPKDQKDFIKKRLQLNQNLIKEREVVHA